MNSYSFNSPVGYLTIEESGGKIRRIRLGKCDNPSPTDLIYETKRQLEEYFLGERRIFDLPLAPDGTEFQKSVWAELMKIPYGETRSYSDIAAALNRPSSCRAVGSANGANPIIIVIPCHRVITKGGALGGYSGGLDIKRKLLEAEGVWIQE
ncbi:MAG: methylated-DNA--[protein]-cysteine S-methyltransferase [Clostridia bacterium]